MELGLLGHAKERGTFPKSGGEATAGFRAGGVLWFKVVAGCCVVHDQRQQLWSSSPTGSRCSDPGMDGAGLDWDYDRGGASGQA